MKKVIFAVVMMAMVLVIGFAIADQFNDIYANVEKYISENGLEEYSGIGVDDEEICKTSCVIDTGKFLQMFPEYSKFDWECYTKELMKKYPDYGFNVSYSIVANVNGCDIYYVVITAEVEDIADWRNGIQKRVEIYCALM